VSKPHKDNELRERMTTVAGDQGSQKQNKQKTRKRESAVKLILRSLPRMKSTSCISCQAQRQVRLEEEKVKVLGSSAKIKIKKYIKLEILKITIYTHI
jgi:capsid protein